MNTTNPFIAAQCDQAGEVCKLTALLEAMGGYEADFAPSVPVALPVVAYLRATPEGQPLWDEGCVCEDPVYPASPEDEGVSMAVVRRDDALTALAVKDAEIVALRSRLLGLRFVNNAPSALNHNDREMWTIRWTEYSLTL